MDFGQIEYTDQSTGAKIILPFPTKLVEKLITKNNMDVEHLSIANVTKLFSAAVGEWLNGKVQTEELSSIANFFIGITKYENS